MPELILMWSAATILVAVALVAVILLGFFLYGVVRRIDDMRHRARQHELTTEQVREVRAFAKRLAKENRVRAEEARDA